MIMSIKKIIVCAVFCLICNSAFCFEALEIFSGFLSAELTGKADYECMPLLVAFDFDSRPLLEKIGVSASERLDLVIEPFLTPVISPDSNIEVGTNFLVKYSLPVTSAVSPYIKAGVGLLYMSQHTREQSTQVNFLPQAGAGLHFFVDKSKALSFEYRFRHLSNASLKQPNKGIDAHMYLAGFSFFF